MMRVCGFYLILTATCFYTFICYPSIRSLRMPKRRKHKLYVTLLLNNNYCNLVNNTKRNFRWHILDMLEQDRYDKSHKIFVGFCIFCFLLDIFSIIVGSCDLLLSSKGLLDTHGLILTLFMLNFSEVIRHCHILGADVLVIQGARAAATMIFTIFNRINLVRSPNV